MQSQNVLTADVESEQALPFVFAQQSRNYHWLSATTNHICTHVTAVEEWSLSTHEMLTQCCFDVGSTSKTVGKHQNNIGSTSRVC